MTPAPPVGALVHPGPVAAQRVTAVATRTTPVAVALAPGTGLADALAAEVARLGVGAAQVELRGGTLAEVSYCIPADCTDGSRAAFYSATRTDTGPVAVAGGAATVGVRDGAPFAHVHAAWTDTAGVLRAGHLWPATTVGPAGLHVVVLPLPGVRTESAEDPETLMPVFTPHPDGPAGRTGARAVVARVHPGEDLRRAADRLCTGHGIGRAAIRGTLGSVMGPVFHGTTGAAGRAPVPGPCTELVALLGEVGPDVATPLHALAVDSDGAVHAGLLHTAASPVAVTAELLLVEIGPA